jgi:ATP-dependent exoDNAse (exonuclease V) beta subunit
VPVHLRVEQRRLLVPVDLPGGAVTVELTPEQREAVELRDGPLFVTAGAGSGKTRVLVERFVAAVVEDGIAVDRLLAITFTEKAAAEMKSRVRDRLLELGQREPAREAEAASISTIHAFCSSLLRANALVAGLDPEYAVLDEAAAARLSLDAFDQALEAFLDEARGTEALDLAAAYGTDKLRQMVVTVHDRLRSLGRRAALEPLPPPRPEGQRERLLAAVAAAQRELGPRAGEGPSIDRVLGVLGRCETVLGALGEDGHDPDPAEILKLAVKTGTAKAMQTPVFDELTEAHAAYLAYCEGTRAAADHALLARLLDLFRDRYAALKDERSGLDFDDLELRARDLLVERPPVRAAVRERYAQVMVDEFQDTNPLQNEILDLVSDGNAFVVGDEDQSIYGFRHADVGLFRDRRARAEADGRARSLRTNFRARPELLAAVNAVFGTVWGERGFEPLGAPAGARDGSPPRIDGPVAELLLVDYVRGRWEEALGEEAPFGETLAGVPPWRAAEARLLARRISELAGPDRPFDHGDVAVLFRAGTDMAAYERAIAELGIPTYAHGGGGWWEAQQVLDLRSYLAALANPRDELALVMVLASPLVGASLGTIACVRLRAKALGRTLWWALEQAFLRGGDGSGGLADAVGPDQRDRLERFVVRFAAERARAPRLSLEALIDRAVTDSGYDLEVLAMPAGDRRLANVRKLMRLARRFEAEQGRDVRRFIDHLDERRLLGGREGEAPVEGESREPAVRLMTIHAAKGLEFPVVCVADLGRSQARDSGSGLEVSDDGRFGLRLASLSGETHATRDLEQLAEEQKARADEEEKRIFHVAMTRAREHLVLSGAVDPEKWPAPRLLGPPIDWIWRGLAPGAKELLSEASVGVTSSGVRCELLLPDAVAGGSCRFGASTPPPLDGRRVEASSAPPARDAPPRFAGVPAPRSLPVSRLSYSALESYKRCGYRFYLERVARLRGPDPAAAVRLAPPARNGQLVLRLEEPPPAEPVPGVTPLLRGTIVHQLLERFDFERAEPPAPGDVEELLEAHGAPVTADEVDRVRALIDGFASSPLRERAAAGLRLRRELPFAFELQPEPDDPRAILVNGVVDVHVEEPGGVLVVDYKTDPLEGADPAPIVAERYATQRLVYALAALRSGAARVDVAYSFLEAPAAPVEATFDAGEAGELEAQLLELARGVLDGHFEPTAEPHRELCLTCPGRAALCSWGPDRTLREHPSAAIPS